MNKFRVFIGVSVAALVAGCLISPVVHAQDDESDGIRDQLQIMTKILEASIGNDSIDRRPTRSSIFESRIRTEYIPTVGAIFTIPISFPLHPAKDKKGNATEDVVEVDLWEHFNNANEPASKAAERVLRLRREAKLYETPLYVVADHDIIAGLKDRGTINLAIKGSRPYDPAEVTTLTHRIIETIAHYGHRLKSLPNSERVLVVLEAPLPRGSSASARFTANEESVFAFTVPRTRELVKEKIESIERERDERRKRTDRASTDWASSTYWIPSVWGQGPGDHRLLAFKKSDLQQERTYDSMKSKVETTDY